MNLHYCITNVNLNVVRWMNYIELAGPIQWVISGGGNVQPNL